ncbi:MAG: glycoside hydrolase family 92 protein [Bacteroidales bacterium]|nr:glycoside hydrolase family 92 protein [Bacteroidales bacterium]
MHPIKQVNDTLIVGTRQSRGWGEKGELYWVNHHSFFAMRFSKPVSLMIMNTDGKVAEGIEGKGRSIKTAVNFVNDESEILLVKVGISAVDENGALQNLDTEIPHWDFDKVAADASKEWEEVLQKVKIQTTSDEKKRTFYTALYHSCIAPFTYSDVDNRYRGFDNRIHKTNGTINYTGLSLWDTFRATHPLFTIIAPEIVPEIIQSMLAQYDEYGLLPVWPLCASETNCMIGYHAVPVIVDAYMKGLGGFDVEKAYEAMKKSAMQDGFGVNYLKEYGFIPSDKENKSVSKTLEYAFDDWCLAQMAKK